jgi:hypothetical protein
MTLVCEDEWKHIVSKPLAVWRSSKFLVQMFPAAEGGQRLSINRVTQNRGGDWDDNITWDELMQIKTECGFGNRWAVEIFPPTQHIVNVANMRHLWLVEPTTVPFAWQTRGVYASRSL